MHAPKRYSTYKRRSMYKPRYHRKRTLTVKPDGIIKEKINVVQDWTASMQYIGGDTIQQRANFLWGSTVPGIIP